MINRMTLNRKTKFIIYNLINCSTFATPLIEFVSSKTIIKTAATLKIFPRLRNEVFELKREEQGFAWSRTWFGIRNKILAFATPLLRHTVSGFIENNTNFRTSLQSVTVSMTAPVRNDNFPFVTSNELQIGRGRISNEFVSHTFMFMRNCVQSERKYIKALQCLSPCFLRVFCMFDIEITSNQNRYFTLEFEVVFVYLSLHL